MHLLFLAAEGKPHGKLSPAALNCASSHELQDLPALSNGYLLDPDLEERAFCQGLAMASPWASQLTNRPYWSRQGGLEMNWMVAAVEHPFSMTSVDCGGDSRKLSSFALKKYVFEMSMLL